MDQHRRKLESLCRLCGGKLKLGKGYIRPKTCAEYSEIFRQNFFIITEDEDDVIFPKNLCNTCKKRLDKLRHSGTSATEYFPAEFIPHVDNNCMICLDAPRKGNIAISLHNHLLDKALRDIGFFKMPNCQDNKKIYFQAMECNAGGVEVCLTLKIADDCSWKLCIIGNDIPNNNIHLHNIPSILNDDNIHIFCELLRNLSVCQGCNDFSDVIKRRVQFKDPFPGNNDERVAWVESSVGKTKLLKENFDTVRSVDCSFLTDNSSKYCNHCHVLRKRLFIYKARSTELDEKHEARVAESSKTNIRHLQIHELEERLRNLAVAKRIAIRKAAKYSLHIDKLLKEQGVRVNDDDNDLFSNIIKTNTSNFEEDSPQALLWQQQMEQASKVNSRSMRWHPLIIRWCLSIYHTSPAAYRHLCSKRNKFIVLPHVNTLKQYINFTTPSSGFNTDIIDRLVEDSDIDNIPEFQKNVSLLFDEIKIKSGLAYKRSTGQLIGFTEMGNFNDEISKFQRVCEADEEIAGVEKDFATYINVFMVRGICSNLCYPFGYHAGLGFTADQLFPLVWEATHVLESVGFKVRAWVCDGASPNRKFFKINGVEDTYWTWNLFDLTRKIYFISDVPHLLKTTRNNLENSHGNRNSRNLHVNGMDISWMHVVSVYEWDLGMHRAAPGLRRLHKLTEDHIRLTPRHRMRVKFAANVLSNSVACALEQEGHADRQSTIKFLKMFDRTFDCLNVMRVKGGGKPDRMPYRSTQDQRFEFLDRVLSYLDEWREQANQTQGMSQEEKNRLCLSHQTDFGWHTTIKSFIELFKLLLEEDGVGYILSEKLSQDPLEEHFARHRRSAGCNDNPTLQQFQQQEVALNLIKSDLIGDLRGNTAGRPDTRPEIDVTDTRLPRKRTR